MGTWGLGVGLGDNPLGFGGWDMGTWGLGVNRWSVFPQLSSCCGQGLVVELGRTLELGFRGGTCLGTILVKFGDTSLGFDAWEKGTYSAAFLLTLSDFEIFSHNIEKIQIHVEIHVKNPVHMNADMASASRYLAFFLQTTRRCRKFQKGREFREYYPKTCTWL